MEVGNSEIRKIGREAIVKGVKEIVWLEGAERPRVTLAAKTQVVW